MENCNSLLLTSFLYKQIDRSRVIPSHSPTWLKEWEWKVEVGMGNRKWEWKVGMGMGKWEWEMSLRTWLGHPLLWLMKEWLPKCCCNLTRPWYFCDLLEIHHFRETARAPVFSFSLLSNGCVGWCPVYSKYSKCNLYPMPTISTIEKIINRFV